MHWLRQRPVLLGAIGLITAALVLLFVWPGWQALRGPARLDTATAEQLVHDKNLGLGLLENQKLAESIPHFEHITAELPEDPLGYRNVLIARILALGDEEQPAAADVLASAENALEQVKRLEPDSAVYHWFAARVAIAQREYDLAESHLQTLLEQNPDDAPVWYALYRLEQIRGQGNSPAAGKAITESRRLAPGNLWVLVEWLRWTGRRLGEDANSPASEEADERLVAKYAPVQEQLELAHVTIKPIVHEVITYSRVDPQTLLEKAEAALQERKWQDASASVLALANLLLPHSLPDQQSVRRHPLEFVLSRFQPAFYQRYRLDESVAATPIKVTFETRKWLPTELNNSLSEPIAAEIADFDLDGWMDVIVLTADQLTVLGRKDGHGDWQTIASRAVTAGSTGLIVQDFDADFEDAGASLAAADQVGDAAFSAKSQADGQAFLCPTADVDVLVYGESGFQRFENKLDRDAGSRSLQPVSDEKAFPSLKTATAAAAADLDADGDLDLAMASDKGLSLISNNGDWSFTDISSRSSLPADPGKVSRLLAADWDRDLDIDVLVAAPAGGGWLENLRHGQFRWHEFAGDWAPLRSATALELTGIGDNASWDVLAANAEGIELLQTQTPMPGLLRPTDSGRISNAKAGDLSVWDYDNDGIDDVIAWDIAGVSILHGLSDGKYEPAKLLPQLSGVLQCRSADFDNDHDLDLLVVLADEVLLFENQGGNANHAIEIALQGQQIKGQQISASGRVTPQGIGSLVELKAGEQYQPRVVRSQRTHFGLGKQSAADVIRVTWLNGVPQNIIQPAADLFICEQQVLNTSCPYLYAWNGERFEFVTDLLWNAPLGLQLEDGVLAPGREWEYLKISGDQLAPRDGFYELQFTEELWEVVYVDQVRLIAIDHPAEVEIYSNEKVGSAELAAYKVHTVREPKSPLSAVNENGRNLLPELLSADDLYAQVFDEKLQQGLTADSHLDLDLGDLGQAERVTLFLSGWVYPAATSMNVAMSSNSKLPLPKPPSLSVSKDGQSWREVLPFMGFPGGKTKTIAIDLSGLLQPGERHVRMATTMEFYWDHIFFTVDDAPAEVREIPLELVSADLHYRGFSRVERDKMNGPERFHYDEVSTAQKWPPMLGKLTAFGDVADLLRASDDRQVVFGAGDEITLRFAVPPEPPPTGWKRDFLLHNVGWEKDANLHTVLGVTVEPLPYLKMPGYPFPSENDPRHESAEFRHYLHRYQTRDVDPGYWRTIHRWQESNSGPAKPAAARKPRG